MFLAGTVGGVAWPTNLLGSGGDSGATGVCTMASTIGCGVCTVASTANCGIGDVEELACIGGGGGADCDSAGSASAGNVAAAVGLDTTTEASQPPRGSRKAEVVATCINKMLYDSGDAILDPGLATDSIRNTPDCISEVPEAMHEARSRVRDRDE